MTNEQVNGLVSVWGNVDSSSYILDIKGKFWHFDFPHGDDGVKYRFWNFVTIFASFLNQNKVLMNFVAHQISNQADSVRTVLFFCKCRVYEELVHNLTVFGRVIKIGDFQHKLFIFWGLRQKAMKSTTKCGHASTINWCILLTSF